MFWSAGLHQHDDGLYVCFVGREGGWCVIVGTFQGKEGEAQELEQLLSCTLAMFQSVL